MAIANTLSRVISLWALLGGVLLLVIVVATCINALGFTANTVARTWGGSVPGLSGYEDGVTMLVGVAALAMFPYCQLHGGHAVVEVFMQRAPSWANRFVEILSGLMVAALALGLAGFMVYGTLEVRGDNIQTAVLGWPVWVFMVPGVVSCVLWAIAALLQIRTGEESLDGA
jgi:TRAP-type C4-dicarboxylate transport system permease small subunit